MNKQFALLSTLAVSLLASFAVHAADTTELKVKGVIRPAACTPTLTGGGMVDYGNIPASSLTAGGYTKLGAKQIGLTVSCDAATKIAIRLTDNRVASKVAGITSSISRSGDQYNYGLGAVDGKNVGGYAISMAPETTADGASVTNLYADGNAWSDTTTYLENSGTLFSFGATGTKTPLAAKSFNLKLNVETFINKKENLDLTKDVPLDGSATIEVRYL
jgi:type 1 fimbria pilin